MHKPHFLLVAALLTTLLLTDTTVALAGAVVPDGARDASVSSLPAQPASAQRRGVGLTFEKVVVLGDTQRISVDAGAKRRRKPARLTLYRERPRPLDLSGQTATTEIYSGKLNRVGRLTFTFAPTEPGLYSFYVVAGALSPTQYFWVLSDNPLQTAPVHTTPVNAYPDGYTSTGFQAGGAVISGDGRHVFFNGTSYPRPADGEFADISFRLFDKSLVDDTITPITGAGTGLPTDQLPGELATDRTGSVVAFLTNDNATTQVRLWTWRRATGALTQIADLGRNFDHYGAEAALQMSADGRYLAVPTANQDLTGSTLPRALLFDLTTGAREVLAPAEPTMALANFTISDDARYLGYWHGSFGPLRLDRTTGEVIRVGRGIYSALSPDGRYMAYIGTDEPNAVVVADLDTGISEVVMTGFTGFASETLRFTGNGAHLYGWDTDSFFTWDRATGQTLITPTTGQQRGTSLSMSDDGTRLVFRDYEEVGWISLVTRS